MPTLPTVRNQVRDATGRGDYEGAMALAQGIRRRFPEDLQTRLLLGQIQLELERLADARESFRTVLGGDPESIAARSLLAIVYEEECQLEAALGQFARAFELDASNGQLAGEVRRLRSLVKEDGAVDPVSSVHAIARRFLKEGLYEEAIPLFEKALESAAEPVLVALGLAQALWRAGRLDEAGDVAREILAGNPNCLKALAMSAGAASQGANPDAQTLLERAWRLDPAHEVARGLFESAGLRFPAGELNLDVPEGEGLLYSEAADSGLETAGDAGALLASARAHQSQGRFDVALDEYRAALRDDRSVAEDVLLAALAMAELAPNDPRVRWLAGDALAAEGRLRRAMEQYLMVLRRLPEPNQQLSHSHNNICE